MKWLLIILKFFIIEFIIKIFRFILKDTASFFFGSITLAYAIQRVNLHKRVALFVLTHIGSSASEYELHTNNRSKVSANDVKKIRKGFCFRNNIFKMKNVK